MRATFGLGYLAGAVYAPFAVESFGWAASACSRDDHPDRPAGPWATRPKEGPLPLGLG